MISTQFLGLLSALASAVLWGTGDFAGGFASRRSAPIFVLMLASVSGLVIFTAAAVLLNEPIPSSPSILWSAFAGLLGGLGLVIFYRALSTGPASVVAPSAAVVGAAVPVVVEFQLEGAPSNVQLLGILLGLAGILLVSSTPGSNPSPSAKPLALALLAGLGFGGFFVLIAQIDRGSIFVPLAIVRLVEFALSAGIYLVRKRSLPSQTIGVLPFVAGILDGGGNFFYLLAIQSVRFDIAAVISSMYPGTTVLLAKVIQHERISLLQSLGIALSLSAVGLIAIG